MIRDMYSGAQGYIVGVLSLTPRSNQHVNSPDDLNKISVEQVLR